MKTLTISAIAVLAFTAPAFAGGHTAKDRAQLMVQFLQNNEPGTASIASTLRPGTANGEALGVGGWGNIGSALSNTVTNTPVSPANPKNVDLTPAEE